MLKQQFFLHIGLPKTGTTYLQNQIFKYYDIKYYQKESIFGKIFFNYLKTGNAEYLELIIRALKQESLTLHSNETISDLLFRKELEGSILFERLKALQIETMIIISKRNEESFLKSYYLEHVKWNSIKPFSLKGFVKKRFKEFDYNFLNKIEENKFQPPPKIIWIDYDSHNDISEPYDKIFVKHRLNREKKHANIRRIRKSLTYRKYLICCCTNFLFHAKYSPFGKYRFRALHLRNNIIDFF